MINRAIMGMEGEELYYTTPIESVQEGEPLSENPTYDGLHYEQVDAVPAVPVMTTTDIQDNTEQRSSRHICFLETITRNKLLSSSASHSTHFVWRKCHRGAYLDAKLVATCISK